MHPRIAVIPATFAHALSDWIDHRAASKGAALAFYTLFSLAPILVLAVTVAGRLYGEAAAQGQIVEQVQRLVGPLGAQAIQALLAGARDPVSGVWASAVAGLMLLFGASSVFVELKESLDELWGLEVASRSPFRTLIRTRLLSFILVAALALLLLLSLLASAAVALLERAVGVEHGGFSGAIVQATPLISYGVAILIFSVLFKSLSDSRLTWHQTWVGSLVTASLFTLGKLGIGFYLSHGAVSSSFGAAGAVVALMVWVYYSAQIFYFGAAFTYRYALACESQVSMTALNDGMQ